MSILSKQEEWIRKWKKTLKLTDYKHSLKIAPPSRKIDLEPEDCAKIDISLGNKQLDITFNEYRKDDWNEDTVVHELVHAPLYRLWLFVEQLIDSFVRDKKARKAFKKVYEDIFEDEIIRYFTGVLIEHKRTTNRKTR